MRIVELTIFYHPKKNIKKMKTSTMKEELTEIRNEKPKSNSSQSTNLGKHNYQYTNI